MKLAYFWTAEFSKNILKWIIEIKNNYKESVEVSLVVSQPDKAVWREKKFVFTQTKEFALENKIKVLQPERLKNNIEFFNELKKENFDFIIVVAYWKIIPKEILELTKYGCINIHWSILPKYRWASPIQETLKNWDKLTWLTIMYMSEGLDEWDLLKIEEIKVDIVDKTPDIYKKFEYIWPKLLLDTLFWVIDWKIKWIPQDNTKATYCKKIEKENWLVDFKKESSLEIYNKFRAYYIWPWIYTNFMWKKLNLEEISLWNQSRQDNGQIWQVIKLENKKIWVICTDNKAIILDKIKLEWKKSMSTTDFVNWNKNFISVIL